MNWALGIGVYFVLWWLLLTAVLPWGVKTQQEAGEITPGTEPSSPVAPYIGRKLLANTVIAGVVWLLIDLAYIFIYLRS